MKRLFKQFSFPGGIPSHVAPETPGSIHEGGELGYALSHAFGAAFDNPDLIVACVIGDGEAETGPLATSWHSNKFLNPLTDGVVLPILHLNGYKIANPCVLARISHEELDHLFRGYGYEPHFVEGSDPETMHQLMAGTLDSIVLDLQRIKADAKRDGGAKRPMWPMIVLRSPKGWTCPRKSTASAPRTTGAHTRCRWATWIRPSTSRSSKLDEELQARGVVRQGRPPETGNHRICAGGRAAHERQSARQWRVAAARPAPAGLP